MLAAVTSGIAVAVAIAAFTLTKVIGTFEMLVIDAVAWVVCATLMTVSGHPFAAAIYTASAVVAVWGAWRNRRKRRRRKLFQKLGYKARALRDRLVEAMPKARPTGQPSPA